MRISKQLMILIGLLAVITAGDCFAKSISVQIREGIYKEQMEGDIDGAIAIYQKVIETAAVNKRYAAEANYRIGLCMIKKGDKARAAQYFNKVMQDFADQKTVVLKTKKELSKLGVGEIPGDVPVIVGTSPEPFANDISPDLNKITVTFDRKMMDGSWSWTGGGDTYPQTAGKIHYDASRTKCTLPVKLKPGKVYWVGINSPSNKNFKTPDRKAAKWYIILFATKNAQGNPTPIPADMLERAKTINARSGASTTKKASNGKPIELLHDDGKSAGKWSLAGGGHAVRFTAAAGSTLEGVRIYGSRYGDAKAPNEDFSVWLCDTGYNPIEEFKFPYSKFAKRGYLNWVNLKTASTALPDEFIICVGFDAEQRKGVYVHHDGQSSGNSLSGLPREMEAFDKGDWMIRAIIKTATSAADSETNNSQISPQATVEAFLKAVLSKSHTESRKAKFYIDAGSALIHQLKAFPKIIKDQKLTIESVRSDSTGAIVFTSKINVDDERPGQLVFTLEKQRGLWFITDVDAEDDNGAENELDQFLKDHPSAKKVEVKSADTSNLQQLIDEAKPLSTVVVPDGIYTVPVRINKPLTIKGQSRDGCVFEVTANEPAIMVDTKGKGVVNIQDMTIKWQLATSDKTIEYPMAIAVKDANAEISNCVFRPLGNAQRSPIAVRSSGFTSMNITNCDFEGFDYVICYGDGTSGTVRNCYIADCGHQGVISYSGAKINLTGNIITGSKYHAVRNTGGTLSMKNNLIINNANRGIYLGNKTGQGKIYSNIIIGNGTGIGCFAGSKYDILYNIIMNNSYSGISMEKSCRLGMKGNILAGNERGLVMFDRGEQGSNDVRANTFWNNKTNAENITLPGTTITEEPQFRDAPNGDFSLTEGTVKEKQQGLTNADAKELWTLWVKWQKRKGNQL